MSIERRAKSTYLTVPMALIVLIVGSSAGEETTTKTSLFFSLMAVERPPTGMTPNREKGTEKIVMEELIARMTSSDMIRDSVQGIIGSGCMVDSGISKVEHLIIR